MTHTNRQRWFSVLVLVAILITAIAPTPRTGASHQSSQMFYLAEEDYNTPFIGSYLWMRALPIESKSFAGFAGYEQTSAHLALGSLDRIVHITRFAGDLLEVADLKFLAREESSLNSGTHKVYLSERFWRRFTGGDLDILGREIMLDGKPFRVAGVLYDDGGYFAGTEVWAPMRLSEPAARAESLRIFGRLREGVSWKEAQKELTRLARGQPNPLRHLIHCKLIPATEPIIFMDRDGQLELVAHASWRPNDS